MNQWRFKKEEKNKVLTFVLEFSSLNLNISYIKTHKLYKRPLGVWVIP